MWKSSETCSFEGFSFVDLLSISFEISRLYLDQEFSIGTKFMIVISIGVKNTFFVPSKIGSVGFVYVYSNHRLKCWKI